MAFSHHSYKCDPNFNGLVIVDNFNTMPPSDAEEAVSKAAEELFPDCTLTESSRAEAASLLAEFGLLKARIGMN